MTRKTRVLVVDDSALMRKLIPQVLAHDSSIEVVGTAMDGLIGLRKIEDLQPDVVTVDLEMPRMDGPEMLRHIMRRQQVPIIVVSAHTEQGAALTMKALQLGAFDFVTKPQDAASGHLEAIGIELAAKIKAAAKSGAPKILAAAVTRPAAKTPHVSKEVKWPSRIVAIGVSTGGPNAIEYLLSQLTADFAGCILIVQHMPEGFTGALARRLHASAAIDVKEAQSADSLVAGRALICPGNLHMKVRRLQQGDIVVLSDEPAVNGHRPSVDVLFKSVAKEFGTNGIAVLMTGMGEDGVAGMQAVQAAGGLTIAQAPDTCVVDSMPRSAIERGFASCVAPLSDLGRFLETKCSAEQPQLAKPAAVGSSAKENARRRS